MTYARRLIDVTFRIGEGAFGGEGSDTVVIKGLRVSAAIIKAGGNSLGVADVRIYGMLPSLMNRLSTLGLNPIELRQNSMSISAYDEGQTPTLVFVGDIQNGWVDFANAPDVSFNVHAFTGLLMSVKPFAPTSYPQPTPAATILENLATSMNLQFENTGVDVVLPPVYLPGTLREQAQRVVQMAGIEWNGCDGDVMAIWPRGSARGSEVPEIGPQTGMQGYPTYTSWGVSLRATFPNVANYGGKIRVKSSLQAANGEWVVYRIIYNLESETPGGQWSVQMEAARPGYVPVG
jgi:hypothetical protein